MGAEDVLLRIDTRLNAPMFFGEIAKWFFIILFFMASSEILGRHQTFSSPFSSLPEDSPLKSQYMTKQSVFLPAP
jgi:hypothetical protein